MMRVDFDEEFGVPIEEACVEWVFEGFWRGDARVEFEPKNTGVVIRGYEQVSPRGLLWLAPLAERFFLEARFQNVWESGWRRLRRQAAGRSENSTPESE